MDNKLKYDMMDDKLKYDSKMKIQNMGLVMSFNPVPN